MQCSAVVLQNGLSHSQKIAMNSSDIWPKMAMSVQWCIAICNVGFFNNFPSLSFLCASTIILHLPSIIERYYLLFSIRIYKEQVREEVSSQYIKFIFLFSTMNKFKKSILVEEILKSSSSFSSDGYETTMTQMMAYHFSMLEIELG